LPREQFARQYAAAAEDDGVTVDENVAAFRELQHAARSSAGLDTPDADADAETYEQYREWLPFAYRNQVVLGRIAGALGYELG
jgi:hypothetical protein